MRRANRAPIFLSKFNSCQLDDWIERLDKLILKVSNIFFPFFFYNVFSFDGQPRSIPPPHFISKRNANLREYQGYRRVLERNKGSNKPNTPCKIGRPSYERVIRVNFRGLQLVDTRIVKTLFDFLLFFSRFPT